VKIDGIDIPQTVASIKTQIEADASLPTFLRATIERLLLIVTLLCNRLGLNSKNSSKSPSSDPDREKQKRTSGNNKSGGYRYGAGMWATPTLKAISPAA